MRLHFGSIGFTLSAQKEIDTSYSWNKAAIGKSL